MIKKIILNIKSFLLTIFFFILIILINLIITLNTILNKQYVINILNKNNYYEVTYNNLKETIESYTIQLGMDASVFLELIEQEKVFNDINIIINGIYDSNEIKIDTNIIGIKLETIINNKLKENNRIPLNDEREAINEFVDTIKKVYEDEIIYSTNLVFKMKEYYPKVRDFLINLIYLFSIGILFILISILLINKDLKLSIRNISISLLTTSLLLITVWGLLRYKFQHILIINLILSKVLICIISNILFICLIIGLVFSLLSLVGIIYSSFNKKILKWKYEMLLIIVKIIVSLIIEVLYIQYVF